MKAALAGGAVSATGVLFGDATNRIQVERSTLRLPLWEADGFRAVVISDLHMDSEARKQRALRALRLAIDERPDVLLVPGDFLTGSEPRRIAAVEEFVKACREAKCPVLGTMGNHDYSLRDPERVIEALSGGAMRLLRNETFEVDGVTVAGFDDALFNRHRPDVLRDGRESPSLLAMLHEPDFVSDVPAHVALMVSGHSHGGQVCLPLGIAMHTPKGARRYIDGYYPDARVPLFVSRGIGTTGPDYRLFCPPQVAVLTLQRA
jgi:uncharacterized protein